MRNNRSIFQNLDWFTIFLFALLVLMGWANIYAAVYDPDIQQGIFNTDYNAGKQFVWFSLSLVLIIAVLVMDFKFYDTFALPIYGVVMLSLILVLLFGREVAGSKSWFDLGGIRIQPAEFAKLATGLAIAKLLSYSGKKLDNIPTFFTMLVLISFPAALIILQGDTGSALVFASFIIVFYREGFPGFIIALGLVFVLFFIITLFFRGEDFNIMIWSIVALGFISGAVFFILAKKKRLLKAVSSVLVAFLLIGMAFSVDYIMKNVLKPHQSKRIEFLVDPNIDPMGIGWQVTQSKIAIGSGGLIGKGFLKGTQTKFDFVPDQSTDFIFCTVGEERGWIGSLIVIGLFIALFFRVMFIAERQKSRFTRIYGYSVLGIFFFHFMVNIGMTIGLFPVIGIPLPFFSYGGSSLWSFTILLFILIKLDAHRMQILARV
ncbi:MAG: rod shape-determining protein RodA [Flammeovirgaceae bacterium]|nr:rod shape-determining protein RodA [Flammeovirgaceae bacterium]